MHDRWQFDEQAAVRRAYIDLLEIPHGALRLRLQHVLATIRDEIAAGLGKEPQEIQDQYEEFVRDNPSRYARRPVDELEDLDG